jgi:hypothetical protein
MKIFTTYARRRLANYAKPASSREAYNNTPRGEPCADFFVTGNIFQQGLQAVAALEGRAHRSGAAATADSNGTNMIEQEILKLIKDLDYVSFAEMSRHIPGFKGDCEMFLTGSHKAAFSNGNIVLWSGLSKEAIAAINSLVRHRKIRGVPAATRLVYMADGNMLRYPLVKRAGDYKTPHWLPMVYRLGPAPAAKIKPAENEGGDHRTGRG